MKALRTLLLSLGLTFLSMPGLRSQTMPFNVLGTLDQAAKECQSNRFVTGYVRVQHFKPDDTRPFTLTLKAPGISKTLEVSEEGEITVPTLPRSLWKDATVTHNLEKGALKLEFWFRFKANPEDVKGDNATIKDWLEALKVGPKEELAKIARIGAILPESLNGATFAVAGLTLRSETKGKGLVTLVSDGKVVETFDLSRGGSAKWMFDKFAPAKHRIVFDQQAKESKFQLDFVPVLAPREKLPQNSVEIMTFSQPG